MDGEVQVGYVVAFSSANLNYKYLCIFFM